MALVILPLLGGYPLLVSALGSRSVLWVALAAVLGVSGYLLFFLAVDGLGPGRAMPVNLTYVLWAALFSIFILHVRPGWGLLLGAAICIAGRHWWSAAVAGAVRKPRLCPPPAREGRRAMRCTSGGDEHDPHPWLAPAVGMDVVLGAFGSVSLPHTPAVGASGRSAGGTAHGVNHASMARGAGPSGPLQSARHLAAANGCRSKLFREYSLCPLQPSVWRGVARQTD